MVVNLTRRFADGFQFFVNYAWSQNKDNASSERDTDTFFGPQDPFDIELDYGRNGLDIPHQFKASATAELGGGLPYRRAVHRPQRGALPGLHPRGHERRRRGQPGLQQRPPRW